MTRHLLRRALTAANRLVIPVATSLVDVRKIGRVLQMVDDLAQVREVPVHVLLTKVRAGTTSARDAVPGWPPRSCRC